MPSISHGKRVIRAKPTPAKRRRVFNRDGFRCVYVNAKGERCGVVGEDNLTIDHIIARDDGGTNDESNLQTMCKLHNKLKDAERLRRREEMKWGIPWPIIEKLNRWKPVPPKGPDYRRSVTSDIRSTDEEA